MRLTFVTGKGGVGKSAVTAALAKAYAGLNRKVGVVELGETRMSDFFETHPLGYEGTSVPPNITLYNLDAQSCFIEYAGRHLPKQALAIIKNRWVHHFIDATPGLNEILILGKITSLLQEGSVDHLLVDAPATGHTISLCHAPKIAMNALKHGPLKSTVGNIIDLLNHSGETGFLIVTQLENFILQETIELYRHLTGELKLNAHGVLINGRIQKPLDIPKTLSENNLPPEAKPLLDILLAQREKQEREKKLLKDLKRAIPLETGDLFREESVTKESELIQKLSKQLKPWILKN